MRYAEPYTNKNNLEVAKLIILDIYKYEWAIFYSRKHDHFERVRESAARFNTYMDDPNYILVGVYVFGITIPEILEDLNTINRNQDKRIPSQLGKHAEIIKLSFVD